MSDHPMLDAAGELAMLHQTREHTPLCALGDIDWQRARAMSAIDRWVVAATPIRSPPRLWPPHTMGQGIALLAQLAVHTYIALAAPEPMFYDASLRLAVAASAYQDFADETACGIRRLPSTLCPGEKCCLPKYFPFTNSDWSREVGAHCPCSIAHRIPVTGQRSTTIGRASSAVPRIRP
ncbi:hypothetical protein [Nocardia sp. NPDC052112]|uniref:hypothetical protein n=1 Tax=Nocardia sp. NPDC052112 TaxID=3155646 RepID=UPI00344AD4CD